VSKIKEYLLDQYEKEGETMTKEPFCLCAFCNCDYDLQDYAEHEIICGACVSQCYEPREQEIPTNA
jgi:hypothetical protein